MVLGQDAMAFTLKLDIRKRDPSVGTQRQGKLEVTGRGDQRYCNRGEIMQEVIQHRQVGKYLTCLLKMQPLHLAFFFGTTILKC